MTTRNLSVIIHGNEAEFPFSPYHKGAYALITLPFLIRGIRAYGTMLSVCIFIFWRYEAIKPNSSKDMLINEDIKAPEVRVIGPDNEQLGIMKIDDARTYAYNNGVDLVLIVANATPPVCRAIDYGKFCFERDKREKEAKKKQVIVKVKEVQLSCRIEQHDFDTRVNHAKKFLAEGNKVKAVVRFKGREMSHMDLGREVIAKFEEACRDAGVAEKKPVLEGRFMSIILSPVKQDKK